MTPEEMVREFKAVGRKHVHHIVHVGQVRSIIDHGLLSKNNVDSIGIAYRDIALPTAQERRDRVQVLAAEDGEETSQRRVPLHSMASFYFNPRNAMLYRRLKEGERLCIIVARIEDIVDGSRRFSFSDGNLAANASRSFADPRQLPELPWQRVLATDFTEESGNRRATCAEFLVESVVPAACLQAVVVQSEPDARFVAEQLRGTTLEGAIWIDPEVFFVPQAARRKFDPGPPTAKQPSLHSSSRTVGRKDRTKPRGGKIRIDELAVELGIPVSEMIDLCEVMGISAKGPSRHLAEPYADMVRRRFTRDRRSLQWGNFASSHRPGQLVEGLVGEVFPLYATVSLPDRIEGRVDLAEMTSQPLGDARHFLSPNERLWVQILSLDHNNMRVDLSVRRAAEVDPSEE